MKILGIETSCDETALSIVECSGDINNPHFEIIDSALLSQMALHAPFGGVVPGIAKREHEKNLPILLEEILKRNGEIKIEAIAVTQGPGLEPALWTGITFAKELGNKLNVPVIPTNHMEGHIVSVLLPSLDKEGIKGVVEFPSLALLISGGHTQLVKVNSWGSYGIIGDTRDDAVGEAFDKVARIIGLPYPGGPEISKLANLSRAKRSESTFIFPRPMLHTTDLDFSFSGLKTSVLYTVQKIENLTDEIREDIAHGFEDAVTEVIVKKTKKALEEAGAQTLIVGGGVIANSHIRSSLQALADEMQIPLLLPTPDASTDNALMIAAAGYISFLQKKSSDTDFRAEGNQRVDR